MDGTGVPRIVKTRVYRIVQDVLVDYGRLELHVFQRREQAAMAASFIVGKALREARGKWMGLDKSEHELNLTALQEALRTLGGGYANNNGGDFFSNVAERLVEQQGACPPLPPKRARRRHDD